jgi:hypothetical protein
VPLSFPVRFAQEHLVALAVGLMLHQTTVTGVAPSCSERIRSSPDCTSKDKAAASASVDSGPGDEHSGGTLDFGGQFLLLVVFSPFSLAVSAGAQAMPRRA